MSERGQGSCSNCKGVYFNRYKPKNCTTCGFYLGGTYQPRPKKTKPNNPDCVLLVDDHLGTRIYSVKTHARDFRCLVIQENGIFQCLSTKCLDVRATFLNSEKPELFSCAHTSKATDAISPLKTYQLSEEVIEHYKCDDSTKDTLRSVMESSPLPSVVQVSESTFCVNGFSSATNPTGYCHVKAANDNVIVCSSQECKGFAQKTKHVRHKKICLHVHVLLCTKSQMNEEESATSTSSTTTQTQSAEVEVETVNTSRKSTIRLNMQHSIPYTIPDCILSKIIENDSKAALNMGGWPKELSPLQVQCPLCNGNLTEARIHPGQKKDDHGLLVTNGAPFRPIKIHVKHCKSPSCKAMVQVFPFEIGDYWKTGANLKWTRELTKLPKLTIKEIEEFFGHCGKTGKTQKRSEILLFDDFLDNLQCYQRSQFFYLRGVCSASYKKDKFHKLSCALDIETAKIGYAYCTCVAGRGGFCNHIYAMLKLVAQFTLDKLKEIPEQLPCTSRPCGWTVPRVRKMGVTRPAIMETIIKKPKLENQKKKPTGIQCTLYEARSSEAQIFSPECVEKMQKQLNEINPMIGLVHGLCKSISNSEDWIDTRFGKASIYSPLSYQCSKFGNNFKIYINFKNVFPQSKVHNNNAQNYPNFPHKEIPQYFTHDSSNLPEAERTILKELELTNVEATELEEGTRAQSNNALWYKERRPRITASRVHDIFQWKRGLSKHADKFVNPPPPNMNPIVQRKLAHGKMYEPVAWEKYECCMQDDYDIQVLPCGLVVNTNNCWLGCSPDAKIVCGDLIGIGESKCPEQYKDSDVFDVAKSAGDNFLLQITPDNKLDVRKNHPCYFQVQCQLAVTGAKFCDLVVYTFSSIAIVRVTFDSLFWDNVVSKIGSNYFEYILPKLSCNN